LNGVFRGTAACGHERALLARRSATGSITVVATEPSLLATPGALMVAVLMAPEAVAMACTGSTMSPSGTFAPATPLPPWVHDTTGAALGHWLDAVQLQAPLVKLVAGPAKQKAAGTLSCTATPTG